MSNFVIAEMKKVLFITPFLPYPLSSGGHQAIFNGISAVKDDIEAYLTYIEYSPMEEERKALGEALGDKIRILPFENHINVGREKTLNLIYKAKYNIKRLLSGKKEEKSSDEKVFIQWLDQIMPKRRGFLEHINKIIEEYKIDIVQCEMLESAAIVLALPESVKKIFVEHEIGFVRKSLHPILSDRTALEAQSHLAINQAIEVYLLNKYDCVITLSETDREKLQDAGVTTGIHTSFAIVNTLYTDSLFNSNGKTLSFIGPEWHPSNKQGILWFLDNCWEDLKEKDAEYKLNIIGKWTSETQKDITSKFDSVHFLGYVDNLSKALENTIMIVPITIGSGIRMKILDACAVGIPVVTTSIGVEGLPLKNGEDCFISDTPEGFTGSIIKLCDSPLCNQFVMNSRTVIQEHYSIDALHDNRIVLYQ